MKKVISVVLALVMVLGVALALSACGDKTPTEPATGEANTAEAPAAKGMTITEGKLIMATNATFPPYEYVENDTIVGIDAEIAKLIADKLGLELVIENVEFDSIIAGVAGGKYDMGMAGMTVTEERKQNVNFTDTYATGVQAIIVREDSAIQTDADIATDGSMKIGVQQGTTGDIYASSDPEDGGFGEDNVIRYKNGPDATQALLTGKVDCVIIDNEPAKAYVAANEGLKVLDAPYTEEDYAICTALENTALLDAVNGALKALIADGSVQAIIDKYIPTTAEAESVSE